MKKCLTVLFSMMLIMGCAQSPVPENDPEEARTSLIEFMLLLNTKEYEQAAQLYGGSYELMQTWNPDIAPSDHVQLWEHACEWNGLMCLEVRTATLREQQGDTFVFQVEFSNPDGSLFVQGPCCGASEEEMPPVSQFEYLVGKTAEGTYLVLTLPPYVP